MSVRKFKKDGTLKESAYQSALLKVLRKLPNVMALRQNVFSGMMQSGRFLKAGHVGIADLLILIESGNWVMLELKSAGGKLRPEQEEFRDEVTRLGGKYLVLSADLTMEQSVITLFETAGVPPPIFKPKKVKKTPQLLLIDADIPVKPPKKLK